MFIMLTPNRHSILANDRIYSQTWTSSTKETILNMKFHQQHLPQEVTAMSMSSPTQHLTER